MVINRYNYEEFFLLYVDNELNAHEKTAVENFINQNPDLAQELETLQQATLSDNIIQFTNKELLYKIEKGISLANYEEYFLLSADNELSQQQLTEVENFVLKHPRLQNEFTLLHQMKLEPEMVPFADRQLLYRHEKERRIIPLFWMRMSAAGIIGIIITTVVLTNNKSSHDVTALTHSEKIIKTVTAKNNKPLVQKTVTEKPAASLTISKERKNNLKNTEIAAVKSEKVIGGKHTEKEHVEQSVRKIEFKPQHLQIAKINSDENKNAAREQIIVKPFNGKHNVYIINDSPGNGTNELLVKQSVIDDQPVIASHAVYIETDNDEEEKTLYIGAAKINKNKLKGLFKKATVFLDKKLLRSED